MENLSELTREELNYLVVDQMDTFKKAKRMYMLHSFFDFCCEVLGMKDLQPFHKDLCNFMQDNRDKKRLILLPRGHLKSTIVTVGYSLWRIAQNPKIRILIANATSPMAEAFLSQIKAHLQKNPEFIDLFGDLTKGSVKWSTEAIQLARPGSYDSKENTVTAFGIGGNLVSQHYDVILMDDLVNRENIHTPDRIADVMTFYKDVQDLVDDPLRSEQILIGTRWHEADLYGTILDDANPEKHKFAVMKREAVEGAYELIKKPDGRFGIEGGQILFEVKFPREALEDLLNAKGPSEFSAQYLNDPVPSSESTFKYDWKYYEEDDLRGKEVYHYITLDPAFFDPHSKKTDLDYTVFLVNAVDAENNWHIRDIIRDRMKPEDIIEMIFDLDLKWKPKAFGIESVAFQKILAYEARRRMRERNRFIPIVELKHAGSNAKSKYERIQALEPRYAIGSILHGKEVRHTTTLEMELRRFPRARTDDIADALANQLEIATPPRKNERRGRGGVPVYPA